MSNRAKTKRQLWLLIGLAVIVAGFVIATAAATPEPQAPVPELNVEQAVDFPQDI